MNKKIFLQAALTFFTVIATVNCGHQKTKSDDSVPAPVAAAPSAEDYRKIETKPVAWTSGKVAKPTALWPAGEKKVHVIRLMATWCPYCKNDLKHINERFANGTFQKDKVKVHMLTYDNRKEKLNTVQSFMKKAPKEYAPLNTEQFSVSFWDKTYNDISMMKDANGLPLFPAWAGVPFGVVIDCQDRVIFQGHFTESPEREAEQYEMIQKAQATCAS